MSLDKIMESIENNGKNRLMVLYRIKIFSTTNGNNRMRKDDRVRKIFPSYVSDKELVSGMYKELK